MPKSNFLVDEEGQLRDRNDFTDYATLESTVVNNLAKEISYLNMSILATIDDKSIDYPIHNLFYDFLDELKPAYHTVKITDPLLKTRYKYRPDLFAYDNYGDSSLDWVILAMNDMISPKDFNITEIKAIDEDYLVPILSNILSAGKEYIDSNRSKYKEEGRY